MEKAKQLIRKWKPQIKAGLLALQCVAAAVLFFRIQNLDMIPGRYIALAAALLILLLFVDACLLGAEKMAGPGKAQRIAGNVGIGICLVGTAACIFLFFAVSGVNNTIETISAEEREYSTIVGLYVRADDPAEKLADVNGYRVAAMEMHDRAATDAALEKAEEAGSRDLEILWKPSVMDAFQDLQKEAADAVLVNEAYTELLKDFEGFEDTEEQVKLIEEFVIADADLAAASSDQQEAAESSVEQEPGAESTAGQETKAASREMDAEKSEAGEAVTSAASETSGETGTDHAMADEKQDTEADAGNRTPGPFTVYISGSDTRKKILTTSRSDVNILMTINPMTHEILLVNTPRDYYVANPAGNGALDKLTHCGLYGKECSMEALELLYDVDVRYYLQMNFSGFERLVDAVGGITVESDTDFVAWTNSKVHIKEGTNKLNGKEALAFARERYALARGDNDRGRNQMQVITAIIDKVSSNSVGLLANYSEILESLKGMFVTDIPSELIRALVKLQLDEMPKWKIHSFAVIGTGSRNTTYSSPSFYAYVMLENEVYTKHASDLMKKVLDGGKIRNKDLTIDAEKTAEIQEAIDKDKKAEQKEQEKEQKMQKLIAEAEKRKAKLQKGTGVRPPENAGSM